MRLKIFSFPLLALLIGVIACDQKKPVSIPASALHDWNIALQQAIINDFFSPPVASRMYTYPNLIAYDVLSQGKNEITPLLKSYPKTSGAEENKELVALYSFYFVGKKMVYSFNYLDEHLQKFENQLKAKGVNDAEMSTAKNTAEELSKEFLLWVVQDNYKQTRSETKFTLKKMEGSWKPTPPDYFDALEPHWNKIRPFFLDSASQYTQDYAPHSFDVKNKNSNFYKELIEVKEQVDKTTQQELGTSKYWDCSPMAPIHVSHITYAEKKLTPGGHWMSIARNVSIQQQDDVLQAARTYSLVSLSIMDGFIACWNCKYYYDYIRPVTAIQDYIDSKWKPLILTPNFPEYPSGHSVISGVASTILASIYGENITFTDNAEEPFGMTPRKFTSFSEACDQAAMSRFWAGIHFKKAILDGVEMGRDIGKLVVHKTNLNEKK